MLSEEEYEFTDGLKKLKSKNEYDDNGNITLYMYSYSDGSSCKTVSKYDKHDNVIEIISYDYDVDGNLTEKSENRYTYKYKYYDDDNLMHTTQYDEDGNIIKVVFTERDGADESTNKSKIELVYDEKGNVSSAKATAYDEDGEIISKRDIQYDNPFIIYHPDEELDDSYKATFDPTYYMFYYY